MRKVLSLELAGPSEMEGRDYWACFLPSQAAAGRVEEGVRGWGAEEEEEAPERVDATALCECVLTDKIVPRSGSKHLSV